MVETIAKPKDSLNFFSIIWDKTYITSVNKIGVKLSPYFTPVYTQLMFYFSYFHYNINLW